MMMMMMMTASILFVVASSFTTTTTASPSAVSATASPECTDRCRSCPPTPVCPVGVSLVSAGPCGCCKRCARQIGESCDAQQKCDHHRNLYCSYTDVDEQRGRCVVTPGRACYSSGKVYANGETFQIGCKATCTCMDGRLGCSQQCPITIKAHAPKNCLHPKLVRKPNQCCQEWVCTSASLNNTTVESRPTKLRASGVRGKKHRSFNRQPRVFAAATRPEPISISVRKDKCQVQTTEWSPCSATCGWGISERVSNDNKACKLRKQTRLCQLRPCDADFAPPAKKGKRCQRVVKAPRRVRFSFSGCHSKVYAPKYCGECTDGRCCAPKDTVTKSVKFTCADGFQFKKRMMMIKSCECGRKCAASANDIFYPYRMGGDTRRV